MIIGTTSQFLTILIFTAIGVGIAIILHFIKRKKYKYFVGGVIALLVGILSGVSVFRVIMLKGISGGSVGGALFALFAVAMAIGLFVNVKDTD